MRLFSLFLFFVVLSLFVSSVGTPAVVWLTGFVKDKNTHEGVEDASVIVEIYSTSKGGGFSANSVLSFGKSLVSGVLSFVGGAPGFQRCTDEAKVGDLLWSKTFEEVTDSAGRFDVKLSGDDDNGEELVLEMNTEYYQVLLVRSTGDWEQVDLDAGKADTCGALFKYYGGPGEGEITALEIGRKQVGYDELTDDSVFSNNINDGTILETDIADNAITR
jgi:hypothetical protein